MLTNDLAKWPSLSVIAREALGPVLREQWLQQRGFSSSVSPVDLGNIQGVHYLVRGSFQQQEDNLTIDLQVVDVETGLVVSSLRAHGPETEIPRLEHDLVMHMIRVFDPSLHSASHVLSNQVDEESSEHVSGGRPEENAPILMENSGSFGEYSIHQIDAQLSLERITQHRMQAYRMAEAFWQKGWSAELGQPRYHVWKTSEDSKQHIPLLTFPLSLFMQKNIIVDELKKVGGGDIPSFVHLQSDGIERGKDDRTGASQLFFEQVRKPQRVFVRALNERGELMAVFSKWSWQTEDILQMASPNRMLFPMWPEPFLRGFAEFPLAWVERGEQHVTFDIVVAPIPGEYFTIVLEPIVLAARGEQDGHFDTQEEKDVLLDLKNWIRLNWKPSITEALPVDGYLPANKQTATALLHLQAGKIADVQFLNVLHNSLFSRSLEDLKPYLLGYCVSCKNSPSSSLGSPFQTIRMQLTLVKDLHALQFGSRSH